MEVTVMVLILLEGSMVRSSSSGERDLAGGNYLYFSSTSLSLISDYADESSLAGPGESSSEDPPVDTGNGSAGIPSEPVPVPVPAKPLPIRDSLYVVIPMTLIYSLILLTGLLGNVSTCIVIAKNNYMHTATNYYLFSLAISDLLLLLSGLPQDMYSLWIRYPYVFGEAFCVIRGLAAETSVSDLLSIRCLHNVWQS